MAVPDDLINAVEVVTHEGVFDSFDSISLTNAQFTNNTNNDAIIAQADGDLTIAAAGAPVTGVKYQNKNYLVPNRGRPFPIYVDTQLECKVSISANCEMAGFVISHADLNFNTANEKFWVGIYNDGTTNGLRVVDPSGTITNYNTPTIAVATQYVLQVSIVYNYEQLTNWSFITIYAWLDGILIINGFTIDRSYLYGSRLDGICGLVADFLGVTSVATFSYFCCNRLTDYMNLKYEKTTIHKFGIFSCKIFDLDNATLAKMGSDTSINVYTRNDEIVLGTIIVDFAAPNSITRTTGSWVTDNVKENDFIFISNAVDAANNGLFTVSSVTDTIILVVENTIVTQLTDSIDLILRPPWKRRWHGKIQKMPVVDENEGTISILAIHESAELKDRLVTEAFWGKTSDFILSDPTNGIIPKYASDLVTTNNVDTGYQTYNKNYIEESVQSIIVKLSPEENYIPFVDENDDLNFLEASKKDTGIIISNNDQNYLWHRFEEISPRLYSDVIITGTGIAKIRIKNPYSSSMTQRTKIIFEPKITDEGEAQQIGINFFNKNVPFQILTIKVYCDFSLEIGNIISLDLPNTKMSVSEKKYVIINIVEDLEEFAQTIIAIDSSADIADFLYELNSNVASLDSLQTDIGITERKNLYIPINIDFWIDYVVEYATDDAFTIPIEHASGRALGLGRAYAILYSILGNKIPTQFGVSGDYNNVYLGEAYFSTFQYVVIKYFDSFLSYRGISESSTFYGSIIYDVTYSPVYGVAFTNNDAYGKRLVNVKSPTDADTSALTAPYGIDVRADGKFLIVDSGTDKIFLGYTYYGGLLFYYWSSLTFLFGSTGTGDGQFSAPRGIHIDSSDNIFVVDSGNNRIQKFNSSYTFLMKFGSAGSGNGQFSSPTHVATDSLGNIYVVDRGNNRIQKFDSAGTYVSQVAVTGAFGISIDGLDQIFVTSTTTTVGVQKFDTSFTSIGTPYTDSRSMYGIHCKSTRKNYFPIEGDFSAGLEVKIGTGTSNPKTTETNLVSEIVAAQQTVPVGNIIASLINDNWTMKATATWLKADANVNGSSLTEAGYYVNRAAKTNTQNDDENETKDSTHQYASVAQWAPYNHITDLLCRAVFPAFAKTSANAFRITFTVNVATSIKLKRSKI